MTDNNGEFGRRDFRQELVDELERHEAYVRNVPEGLGIDLDTAEWLERRILELKTALTTIDCQAVG